MHLYTQQTSFYKRKVWCCGKPTGERFVRGGHRWMRLRESSTWKNDRDKWCQSRRPAHPLLAEPPVTCSPANVWNWQRAAGKAAIPLWCSYMFTQQLPQLFHMHTQDLIAFIHQDPDSKLYAPRSCRVLSCHWYRMITEHTSVIIRILPCQLFTSTTVCLIIVIAYAFWKCY